MVSNQSYLSREKHNKYEVFHPRLIHLVYMLCECHKTKLTDIVQIYPTKKLIALLIFGSMGYH